MAAVIGTAASADPHLRVGVLKVPMACISFLLHMKPTLWPPVGFPASQLPTFPALSFKHVFWFLTICLDVPTLSLLPSASFFGFWSAPHSDTQPGFIHSYQETHLQGWKGSTYNCPYNSPVKGRACFVQAKSIMNHFLPHSNLFLKTVRIIWNPNHC